MDPLHFGQSIISMLGNDELFVWTDSESSLWFSFRFVSCWQVKVVGPDSKPVANEAVYLFARDSQNVTLTTDMRGMASFSLDTTLWKDTVSLKVGHFFFQL